MRSSIPIKDIMVNKKSCNKLNKLRYENDIKYDKLKEERVIMIWLKI